MPHQVLKLHRVSGHAADRPLRTVTTNQTESAAGRADVRMFAG